MDKAMLPIVNPSCKRVPYISSDGLTILIPFFLLIIFAMVAFLSSIKMGNISNLAIIVAALMRACGAQITPEIEDLGWPQARRVLGNSSLQAGFTDSKQDLFGRQSCGQGYSQCSTIALNSRPRRGTKPSLHRLCRRLLPSDRPKLLWEYLRCALHRRSMSIIT